MIRAYYSGEVNDFLSASPAEIVGELSRHHSQNLVHLQTGAWLAEISILKEQLSSYRAGRNGIFMEFAIPRMGKRADVVLAIEGVIFVLEFKVGATEYHKADGEQALDYALDLKHFHEGSHAAFVVPILVATEAPVAQNKIKIERDGLFSLICVNKAQIRTVIDEVLRLIVTKQPSFDWMAWAKSTYKPTPTIIQAAQALYEGHKVEEISRNDAGARNLSETTSSIDLIIDQAKAKKEKAICFITGVPGAGKTLAGLNIAMRRMNVDENEHAVFLSGNLPLVEVLKEALAREESSRIGLRIGDSRRKAKAFIQSMHHYRDEHISAIKAPIEKVIIYDEAQRAWDKESASKFMRQKRGLEGFTLSEPEFLIGLMDKHEDWAVMVALIGGGQEINTGEAGLMEWFSALRNRFRHWKVYCSSQINSEEYVQKNELSDQLKGLDYKIKDNLHLGVSIRSFRAEKLSAFVSCLINNEPNKACVLYDSIRAQYPIHVTRNIGFARQWLNEKARGSELYGLVASSGGVRLKPEGINVKEKIYPPVWFLNGKFDVRSCQYLEDPATEFDIQGLELDWVGLCWDADLRYVYDSNGKGQWTYNAFVGTKWQKKKSEDKQRYLLNAYRVLLTRARQGMIIFVPPGSDEDLTRQKKYYDSTYKYLLSCGIADIQHTNNF